MSELAALAAQIGAKDVFVLHVVDGERLVNLDGYGRGSGWAGNVTVDPTTEPLLATALEEGRARARHGFPLRIFGPYWSTDAAAVVSGDHVVVLGGEGMAALEDDRLRDVARQAAATVSDVPAEKRLADELEVAQAALAIATLRPASLGEGALALATRAAHALSCEFGAVLIYGPPIRLFLAEEGWRPAATDEEIITGLLPLAYGVRDEPLVEQDLSCSAFPYHPLAFEDGLVARCAVPLGPQGSIGLLVVAHAADSPRGFTSLCQRVAVTVARTAEPMLVDAMTRP